MSERRCRRFVLLGVEGCRGGAGGCSGGLRVKSADVRQTYELNLTSTEPKLVEAAQRLEAQSPDKRATYVRFAVWGFATVRLLALMRFLAELPLLHELVLPDRDRCPFHLLSVIRLVSGLSTRCPKLLSLVFRDGTVEELWNLGGRGIRQGPRHPVIGWRHRSHQARQTGIHGQGNRGVEQATGTVLSVSFKTMQIAQCAGSVDDFI